MPQPTREGPAADPSLRRSLRPRQSTIKPQPLPDSPHSRIRRRGKSAEPKALAFSLPSVQAAPPSLPSCKPLEGEEVSKIEPSTPKQEGYQDHKLEKKNLQRGGDGSEAVPSPRIHGNEKEEVVKAPQRAACREAKTMLALAAVLTVCGAFYFMEDSSSSIVHRAAAGAALSQLGESSQAGGEASPLEGGTGAAVGVDPLTSAVEAISWQKVLWYSWITAASTGLGALPFLVTRTVPALWLAISNAVAAGMMLVASGCLLVEGAYHDAAAYGSAGSGVLPPEEGGATPHASAAAATAAAAASSSWSLLSSMLGAAEAECAAAGFLAGIAFIWLSSKALDGWEQLKFSGFDGLTAKKMLLVLAVMTLHSFSEGIGIGVSFGSPHGHFGLFISATLAIHNVPEGLAICLVLIPRGVPVAEAALWAILSSLPQPIMALPAFLSVQQFMPLLPAGLGFAAGAMTWLATLELLPEAAEELGKVNAGLLAASAGIGMFALQATVR